MYTADVYDFGKLFDHSSVESTVCSTASFHACTHHVPQDDPEGFSTSNSASNDMRSWVLGGPVMFHRQCWDDQNINWYSLFPGNFPIFATWIGYTKRDATDGWVWHTYRVIDVGRGSVRCSKASDIWSDIESGLTDCSVNDEQCAPCRQTSSQLEKRQHSQVLF